MPLTRHDLDDLVALFLKHFQIVAVNLGGQRALHAAHCLFHVVFDRLRKTPDHAGNLVEFPAHRSDQFVFVLMKDGPPVFLLLQIDKDIQY